jgi:hypothetical protein
VSSHGLISVRIPRSLLVVFRAAALRSKHSLHGGARTIILGLRGLAPRDLAAMPEPPQEPDSPRVSLYVGVQCTSALADFTTRTQLSTSSIVRRLAYALFIKRSIRFVQNSANKEWLLAAVQNKSENKPLSRDGEKSHAAS